MIKGQVLGWIADAFVDRRRIQADGLIVGHIPPPLTITDNELGIETPGNSGIDHEIIGIGIIIFGNLDKMSLARVEASPI